MPRAFGRSRRPSFPLFNTSGSTGISGGRHEQSHRGSSIAVGTIPWPADAQAVQELLGDKDVKTTMVYTYVMNRGGRGVPRRLDRVQQVLPVESWRLAGSLARWGEGGLARLRTTRFFVCNS